MSISSEELVEWDASSFVDVIANKSISEETCNNNHLNEPNVSNTVAEQEKKGMMQNSWPIVDLTKLDLDLMDNRKKDERLLCLIDRDNLEINEKQWENNNNSLENKTKNYERMEKFPLFRKTRRLSMRTSLLVSENNVIWPGVLNYNKILNNNNNFDVAVSLQN